jgi:hypothetical protein
MPLERIYTTEAKMLLSLKSNKALITWCEGNDVTIYSERNRKFMCRVEFITALEAPFIQSLKGKYGENWRDAYQAMQTNDPAEMYEFKEIRFERKTSPLYKLKHYKPVSDFAKSFIHYIIQDE